MPVILQVPPVFRRFVYPWITPAHAGKTCGNRPALTGKKDHPRACGENLYLSSVCELSMGSPPRMRGKLDFAEKVVVDLGITPAHAGKTSRSSAELSATRDHPRACGENLGAPSSAVSVAGSPPRMRGKHDEKRDGCMGGGITPAHAGKTMRGHCLRSTRRDHPRACGENFTPLPCGMMVAGSPPRMRGKQTINQMLSAHLGITPAHAGKTPLPLITESLRRDHPRACGEN